MDITISREEIKEYEKLKLISELSLIKQRLTLFESKYHCSFEEFERQLNQESKEDFDKWDDFIEWKAYQEKKVFLTQKMDQIAHAQDIKITEDS